jgi:glucose-6-phosphate 1-dehydrogenase
MTAELAAAEARLAPGCAANRLMYFAIPPSVFVDAARTVRAAGVSPSGWTRVVLEKPFGHDAASSLELGRALRTYLEESQMYRIDHYLGKEMVQNLMVLRFANAVFEPLWSGRHISTVQITFKEPIGTEGRGGYFDSYGIIRDVMQNHLLQVLSLVAMEPPVTMASEDVRNEKVKALRCVAPLRLEDVVLGQYGPNAAGTKQGYLDDPTVPRGSATPTFATAALYINNARWQGVPFILKCGKALNERKAEIRIQFRAPCSGLFSAAGGGAGDAAPRAGVGQTAAPAAVHQNELVIRIQPDEAVYMKLMSRLPGMEFTPTETELSLSYSSRFPAARVPDAYSRLLLDVLRGEQAQFVRDDELAAAWDIFTPLLHAIDDGRAPAPFVYPYGSRGPPQSDDFVRRLGYSWEGAYAGGWLKDYAPGAGAAALAAARDEFTLTKPRLTAMVGHFLEEMARGLAGRPSTIKMIPSFVTAVPGGREQGAAWAIDLGGSNLRVIEVALAGDSVATITREHKAEIPAATQRGSGEALFDFIAGACVEAGLPPGAKLGFTFSFPYAQHSISSGVLLEWTKGFSAEGVVGQDVAGLLEAAFLRRGLSVRVAALANDTVGTLCAGAYCAPASRVGVILGTGTNAAYIERADNIPKWGGAKGGDMLINMEWGGFGSSGGPNAFALLPFHSVDHQLDYATPNPTKQRFEKMISGMYLGELARLLLVSLAARGALQSSTAAPDAPLFKPWAFTTAAMADVAGDASPALVAVGAVLSALGLPSTPLVDRRVVVEVCELVARRAARLAAAAIAAVFTQMGAAGVGGAAAIDGSVFKKYPRFQEVRRRRSLASKSPPPLRPAYPFTQPTPPPPQWMRETLVELGMERDLVHAEDGSGIGAAMIAVVAAP